MNDSLVTHDEVLRWLPRDVRRELVLALPPEQRGWWTREEAARDGGAFIEGRHTEYAETRCFRMGGAK